MPMRLLTNKICPDAALFPRKRGGRSAVAGPAGERPSVGNPHLETTGRFSDRVSTYRDEAVSLAKSLVT